MLRYPLKCVPEGNTLLDISTTDDDKVMLNVFKIHNLWLISLLQENIPTLKRNCFMTVVIASSMQKVKKGNT